MLDPLVLLPTAIRSVAPYSEAEAWTIALTAPMRSSGITTANRIAMFIGQIAISSVYFSRLSKSLYYLSADHIFQNFRPYFSDINEVAAYIGHPQALANRVYANQCGNGNEASGDGWRYHSRGLIAITFRDTYEAFAKVEPRAADPDWLSTMTGAAESACWLWTRPKADSLSLNAEADCWNVPDVTQRLNGTIVELPARMTACHTVAKVFGATPEPFQITE